ncbi:hypothetical protein ABTK15_20655, partial [Acinetobacter baumannii]
RFSTADRPDEIADTASPAQEPGRRRRDTRWPAGGAANEPECNDIPQRLAAEYVAAAGRRLPAGRQNAVGDILHVTEIIAAGRR